MKKSSVLYWLPRVLALGLNGFLAIFALDVFGESDWLVALGMHLIPNAILLIVTLIAWRFPLLGGVIFGSLAIVAGWFFHSVWLAIPVGLIGILFWISRKYAAKPNS